jgi:nucleoid DNA-binding protein
LISRGCKATTKAELVAQVAAKTQMTQQQTAQVVDLILASVVEGLQTGDKIVPFFTAGKQIRARLNPHLSSPSAWTRA